MLPNTTRKRIARVLVVEDNDARFDQLRTWFPGNIRVVRAKGGGDALGILARDSGDAYAGIMLDYDLHQSLRGAREVKGADVARFIARKVQSDTPILVHSMNPAGRVEIVQILKAAGFSLTCVPMEELSRQNGQPLAAWILEQVDVIHEERLSDDGDDGGNGARTDRRA
jgi:CheY-like chemotaxis protein